MIPDMKDCAPGIRPTGFNVLVATPAQEGRVGSIIIPDNISDRDRLAQVEGRLVGVSPAAFDFAHFPEGTKPKAGDAIMFAKFAGVIVKGKDGKEYRLCLDKDITAVIEEASNEHDAQ
jgi:co-chaperonin GroES (HSP10)